MSTMSQIDQSEPLRVLADLEGFSVMKMLEEATYDGNCPCICTNCLQFTAYREPDAEDDTCPECNTTTVQSCLILAGII